MWQDQLGSSRTSSSAGSASSSPSPRLGKEAARRWRRRRWSSSTPAPAPARGGHNASSGGALAWRRLAVEELPLAWLTGAYPRGARGGGATAGLGRKGAGEVTVLEREKSRGGVPLAWGGRKHGGDGDGQQGGVREEDPAEELPCAGLPGAYPRAARGGGDLGRN
jgi:hypothetical protein